MLITDPKFPRTKDGYLFVRGRHKPHIYSRYGLWFVHWRDSRVTGHDEADRWCRKKSYEIATRQCGKDEWVGIDVWLKEHKTKGHYRPGFGGYRGAIE